MSNEPETLEVFAQQAQKAQPHMLSITAYIRKPRGYSAGMSTTVDDNQLVMTVLWLVGVNRHELSLLRSHPTCSHDSSGWWGVFNCVIGF